MRALARKRGWGPARSVWGGGPGAAGGGVFQDPSEKYPLKRAHVGPAEKLPARTHTRAGSFGAHG